MALEQLGIPALVGVVGIIVGWILTSISTSIKYRIERRKTVASALGKLLPAYFRLSSLISMLDVFKGGRADWTEYEITRNRTFEKHGDVFAHIADLEQVCDAISQYYPMLGYEIRLAIGLVEKSVQQKVSVPDTPGTEDIYVQILSLSEVARDSALSVYRSILYKLARRHGVWTFLQFHWSVRKHDRNNPIIQKNIEVIGPLYTKLMGEVRTLRGAASNSMASD